MKHILIGIANSHDIAATIGKISSKNGITFYNRKSDDFILVSIVPSDPENKAIYLAEVISASKINLVDTSNIGKVFGESVIGAWLMGNRLLITENPDASAMLDKAGVAYEKIKKEGILEALKSMDIKESEGQTRIQIDKSFNVKGIGTVLLGLVTAGKVQKHDLLKTPEGKEVLVRSIQVQDDDVDFALEGARVGLAVKGVEEHDIEKGDILAKQPVLRASRLTASITVSKLAGSTDLGYKEMWLVSGFRSCLCKITNFDGAKGSVELLAKLPIEAGEKFLLVRNDAPRIFAGGVVIEASA